MTPEGRSVLLVARNPRNLELLAGALRSEAERVDLVPTVTDGARRLEADGYGLAVVDVDGFREDVWGLCARLQAGGTPYLVLTRERSPAIQHETLRLGTRFVLEKPVSRGNLQAMVRTLLEPQPVTG